MTGGGDGRVPLGDCQVSKDTESESGGDGSESSSPLRLGSLMLRRRGALAPSTSEGLGLTGRAS